MELDILHSIQNFASPLLDSTAVVSTLFGEQFIILAVVCFVYWVLDKEKGEYISLSLITSVFFNNALKAIFMRPRPIGSPGVRSLRTQTATGSSFPSGHTQNAASGYGALAFAYGKPWLSVLCALIIILVALSRLYLGVHWPSDVAAAAVFGICISASLHTLSLHNIFDKHSAFAIIAAAFVIGALISRQEDMIKAAGLSVGAAAAVRIEHRHVCFCASGINARGIIRYILGIVLTAAVYAGLKALLPAAPVFYFITYAAVAAAVMLLCPWVFVKFGL